MPNIVIIPGSSLINFTSTDNVLQRMTQLANGALQFSGAGGTMTFTVGGNLGIGTTTPGSLLEVNGKTVVGSTSSNALEVFSNGDTEIGFSYATRGNVYAKIIGDVTDATPLGGEIAFQTANAGSLTEKVRINKSGFVGILTSNPLYPLQVYNPSNGTTAAFGGTTYGIRIDNGGTFSTGRSTIYGVDNSFYGSYQPLGIGASVLYFSIFGSDKVTIDSTGVGIGTNSPNELLTLGFADSGSGSLEFRSTTYARLGLITGLNETSSQNGAIAFQTRLSGSISEKMRITSGGNVLIGTTTGDGYKLQIVGNSQATSTFGQTYAGVAAYSQWINSGGSFVMGLDAAAGTTERMRITSGGVVQIGQGVSNDAATRYLQIQGSGTNAGVLELINYWNGTAYTAGVYGGKGSNAAATLLFKVAFFNGSAAQQRDAMFIDENGNVGIGTTSPTTKLHVNGNIIVPANGYIYGNSSTVLGNMSYIELYNGSTGNMTLWTGFATGAITFNTNQGNERMRITSGGNVGIGTSAPNLLTWNRAVTINTASGNSALELSIGDVAQAYFAADASDIFLSAYANKNLKLRTNNADRVTITNTGNVGIGTVSPSNKIDISTGNRTSLSSQAGAIGVDYVGSTNGQYQTIGFSWLGSISTLVTYWGLGFRGVNYSSGTGDVFLFAGGSERLTVTNNGSVGIGTTAPGYSLEVSGDQKITSGALGVNVNPNATDGRIDASNDIVAFSSDRRLKTNIKDIESPLEKIIKLKGFTYNWNHIANKLAKYDTDKSYVGLFAQDVRDILPEAVKLAPFDNDGNDKSISGENYLTVQYEKIVPLLVEAIKEQQSIIKELEQKVYGTSS